MTLANRKLIEKFGRDFTSKKNDADLRIDKQSKYAYTRRSKPRL